MKLHGVEFLPSSLVTCFVQDREVRIVELAYEGFSFRVANPLDAIETITLHFLQFEQSSYLSVVLEEFQVETAKTEEPFFITYTVCTRKESYVENVKSLVAMYGRYISLKLTGDDGYLSEELVEYPRKEDEVFYETFARQKKDWFSDTAECFGGQGPIGENVLEKSYQLAFSLDTPKHYKEYLEKGIAVFQRERLEENYLQDHPLFKQPVKRLYIGSQFCHNLLPERNQWVVLMDKALSENLEITLVFTYLRDELVEETRELLQEIVLWCQKRQKPIEVAVNDWGMVNMFRELLFATKGEEFVQLNLGILLNKYRKDPRYGYKLGTKQHVDNLQKNNVNGELYQNYLHDIWKIARYEYEAVEPYMENGAVKVMEIPRGNHSLHLPYYQTNTSQFCTLYAFCTTGDRGNQKLPRNCPGYCEEKVFLYPKHLSMVGRYNSLFGLEKTILSDPAMVNAYLKQGIDRLVLTLL
ncbi:hypothetical protein [[Clostridium] polysaccharolyticum]|uniref:Uncharacterized protein n=1 Tax=[Clostridium] polysaccharolyticum TaxID=29364 RepID=A0A1I0DET4_9FIRM|nr:hypothetical protein [[Clostridium] polysaccharolyticum]SET30775.1 hypothetical protein SAMN04487772_11433 [[Clostridium] polysaccharolyticum]